ncbi:MAG UNVERIFIED_CONTAM: hypothetical protein LVR18_39840 [Planctomycetaceae bacterium]|jgi:hypothetical protein
MSRQTACHARREKTFVRCRNGVIPRAYWYENQQNLLAMRLMYGMEMISRNVEELRPHERSAAELLPGHRLRGNERLILQVVGVPAIQPPTQDSRPAQTLEDWAHVYEGLSDEKINAIDKIAKTRAILTRDLPGL